MRSIWIEKQSRLAMDNPVDKARRSGKPTLIEFGATECAPCKMMAPIIEELKKRIHRQGRYHLHRCVEKSRPGQEVRHPGHTDTDFL